MVSSEFGQATGRQHSSSGQGYSVQSTVDGSSSGLAPVGQSQPSGTLAHVACLHSRLMVTWSPVSASSGNDAVAYPGNEPAAVSQAAEQFSPVAKIEPTMHASTRVDRVTKFGYVMGAENLHCASGPNSPPGTKCPIVARVHGPFLSCISSGSASASVEVSMLSRSTSALLASWIEIGDIAAEMSCVPWSSMLMSGSGHSPKLSCHHDGRSFWM